MKYTALPLATAAVLVFSTIPAAQAMAATDVVVPEDCEVVPDTGSDDVTVVDPTPANPDDDPTLSDVLDPCDGVLQPEPVGDKDMTIPPPEGGETPIIEPDELPDQQ